MVQAWAEVYADVFLAGLVSSANSAFKVDFYAGLGLRPQVIYMTFCRASLCIMADKGEFGIVSRRYHLWWKLGHRYLWHKFARILWGGFGVLGYEFGF